MKYLRSSLVVLLAVALVATVMPLSAFANTELKPGSRLVFPYVDITSGRDTFLLLTNTSRTISAPTHLTFYGQNCVRSDQPIFLTPLDIAAVDIAVALGSAAALGATPAPSGSAQTAAAGIGWVDVDVRDGANTRNSPSFEFNGLAGIAVTIDVTKDFAFSYPAAAAQGSSQSGFLTTTAVISGNTRTVPAAIIVTRANGDVASNWSGAYETYASRIFIPAFFAEDPCTSSSTALTAWIAVAGPADGYRKEAPGSELNNTGTGGTSTLVNIAGDVFDGVENSTSVAGFAHLLNQRLCVAFPTVKGRPYLNPPAGYASVDLTLGAVNSVGWLNMDNTILTPSSTGSGPAVNTFFNNGNGFNTASTRQRGIVGILFEIQAGDTPPPTAGTTPVHTADVVRNWNDPHSELDWQCFNGTNKLTIDQPGAATCSNDANWLFRHSEASQ